MLPKFASHVLHHTQRAAATAQNYALRNVLGLQNPSASPGSLSGWSNTGSSSWGGYGTGAGGAKYNAGSRFNQNFSSTGRAVTQANSSSANDSTTGRTDDDDDLPLRRPALVIKSRTRTRSSSLSLTNTGRNERAATFGILQTVQLHQARAQHVLSRVVGLDKPSVSGALSTDDALDVPSSPRSVLVRRNSTAASSSSDLEPSVDSLGPQPFVSQESAVTESHFADPAKPQTPISSDLLLQDDIDNPGEPANFSLWERLNAVRSSGDFNAVVDEVENFRSSFENPNVRDYNMVLQTLNDTRPSGQPITLMLQVYNEMLTRQVIPNVRTYKTMISALCDRDKDVLVGLNRLRQRMKWQSSMEPNTNNEPALRQIDELKKECNFSSALVIFEAAQAIFRDGRNRNYSLGRSIYYLLLRQCAANANIDAAVRIWTVLENIGGNQPSALMFHMLLSTYVNANDIESAKEVFDEFRLASKEGWVDWGNNVDYEDMQVLGDKKRPGQARAVQMRMWIKLIEGYFRAKQPEKAIATLMEMMDSKADKFYSPTDIPPPCSSVYAAIIEGFVNSGDIESALSWFERLLKQDTSPKHSLEPTIRPDRPNNQAWSCMLEALCEREMVPELNRLYGILLGIADADGLLARDAYRGRVFQVNVERLALHTSLPKEEVEEITSFLCNKVIDLTYVLGEDHSITSTYHQPLFSALMRVLLNYGKDEEALTLMEKYIRTALRFIDDHENLMDRSPEALVVDRHGIQEMLNALAPDFLRDGTDEAPQIEYVLRYCKLWTTGGLYMDDKIYRFILDAYYAAKKRGELNLVSSDNWYILGRISLAMILPDRYKPEMSFKEFSDLVDDMKQYVADTARIFPGPRQTYLRTFCLRYANEDLENLCTRMGPRWLRTYKDITQNKLDMDISGQINASADERPVWIDKAHSRAVDSYYPANPSVSPHMAWVRYEGGIAINIYPNPEVIGRLITTFGRMNELDKVNKLYQDAQRVLRSYEDKKALQSMHWCTIENQMVIAMAHAGQVDKAHIHRQRIIENGGNLTADAYGALIQCVKETTDDSSNALALWEESQVRGVAPNLYLFNTIISKLSKARKADLALELFQQMKTNLIRPSSVTYGAVIAACCRVGDAQSAEVLFEEMTSQPNFKPRIPPYNTMIQFYVHIVRDRERALHYYNALLASGIHPSAHTYKLLLDCYGTLDPVDATSMEKVFNNLIKDNRVAVQGVHWAALINAWGCIQKNLDKAISVFDSIAKHPSTNQSGLKLPDAIVYEAMINVLVTLRRPDLIPSYLNRLTKSGVHMTAYIANLLIKGFAASGDLERSRQIFESLQDPPVGMAAPNNHAPHEALQMAVAPDAPVYREPSTWETMVRAELGSGNRDNAIALLQRVQARGFPSAVYQRISGIMLDDSVAPWSPRTNMTPSP